MKQILYIGLNPHTLDFSQPGFEPGLTAEKVEQGINTEIENLRKAGYETLMHFLDNGVLDLSGLVTRFKSKKYDGVLIGAGIRIPPGNLILFEKIINTVHEHAPGSKLIFNTNPLNSLESIKRWL